MNTQTNMNMNTSTENQSAGRLIEDAQELLSATKQVGEEKVIEARKRLADALEKARQTWGMVQEKATAGAKAADQVVREHPYHTMGVALGVGAVIGYLLARRSH